MFELFESAHQIDHAGNAQMFGRAGAGFDGYGAQGSRPAFGEDHAVHAGSIGHAQQRAQVLRVFHAIDRENQTRRIRIFRSRPEQIFEGKKLLRAHQRHHALMRCSFRSESQLLARLLDHADMRLAALRNQAFQSRIAALASHEHMIEAALPGLESLLNRVQPIQNFHWSSLRRFYADSLALARRLRLTPCSAARTASER